MTDQASEPITLTFLTDDDSFTWAPSAGWNPSLFPKERIQCTAYYKHFLKTMQPQMAEQRALETIYARKYGLSFGGK
jgi:hypothetical protein